MRKILLAIMLCFAVTMQSCSFIESVLSVFSKNCTKNVTDKYVFRSSVEVSSPSLQLAQEKAESEARRLLLKQIDEYIVENISYKDFLSDGKYEEKIDSIRGMVLNVCENSCSHMKKKSSGVTYSVTIQINRSLVDDIISQYK